MKFLVTRTGKYGKYEIKEIKTLEELLAFCDEVSGRHDKRYVDGIILMPNDCYKQDNNGDCHECARCHYDLDNSEAIKDICGAKYEIEIYDTYRE